jgi:hypothetical protein
VKGFCGLHNLQSHHQLQWHREIAPPPSSRRQALRNSVWRPSLLWRAVHNSQSHQLHYHRTHVVCFRRRANALRERVPGVAANSRSSPCRSVSESCPHSSMCSPPLIVSFSIVSPRIFHSVLMSYRTRGTDCVRHYIPDAQAPISHHCFPPFHTLVFPVVRRTTNPVWQHLQHADRPSHLALDVKPAPQPRSRSSVFRRNESMSRLFHRVGTDPLWSGFVSS